MSGRAEDRAWAQLTPQEQAALNRYIQLLDVEHQADQDAAKPEDPLAVVGGKTSEERQREVDSRYHGPTVDDPLHGLE